MDLKKHNQEQLLKYYNELSQEEKNNLTAQINSIDFDLVNTIYKNSYIDEEIDMTKVSNLKIINKKDTNPDNIIIGENIIRNNEYAIVLMAGGFGSRLGFNKPKGCLKINGKTLFEMFIDQIKDANKKYNSNISLYIMTSNANNKDTISFFNDNNYFDYKEYINIFIQDDFPILNIDGKIVLKNKHEILFGPNGNGDVFNALKRFNLIDDMINKGIKYILFSTIDDPLLDIVDTKFIGTTISNKYDLASKTIMKTDEDNKEWIFCKYNNKPYMLPSRCINKELTNTMIDNEYVYREINITYHLMSIDKLKLFSNIELPYHRAYKNNKYLDEDGNLINTEERNSFKFEKFIFDAFYHAEDMLLYRVNKNEFCPIKEKEDINKVINLLQNKMP
jgi:UDP-N-acetylglucosamine pyrophosphorylase